MKEVELTCSVTAKEPSPIRLVLTLGIAGLISGFILVFVYQFTAPIIAANKAKALREAVFKVVPDSSYLQELHYVDGKLEKVGEGGAEPGQILYGAYGDDGGFMGYAIVGSGNGFQDTIRLLYGYDPVQRAVIGMNVDPVIELVKGGRTEDHHIDAITGATISSDAVVKIINGAHSDWDDKVKGTPPKYIPPAPKDNDGTEGETK